MRLFINIGKEVYVFNIDKFSSFINNFKKQRKDFLMKKNFILLILFAFMMAIVLPSKVFATDYIVNTGEEINFVLTEEGQCIVYYYPEEQGTRTFTSWHSTAIAWDKVAAVTFYYRDIAVPNDPWHSWDNKAVGYLWPKTTQSLYSGSSTIQYKFVFQEWTTPIMGIHVVIQ